MRRGLLVVAAIAFFLAVTLAPRRAAADATDSLLISAYVAGGVAVIALIAILFAEREDEPDFYELVEQGHRPRREEGAAAPAIVIGCRGPDGSPALACW
jgi:hypothetical protein